MSSGNCFFFLALNDVAASFLAFYEIQKIKKKIVLKEEEVSISRKLKVALTKFNLE